MRQWVDITTIDNNTPFTKVRWIDSFTSGGDKWFSEAPGLITNNMYWYDGNNEETGWYGGHRMNSTEYTCGFQCDVTGIDNGLTPNVYRTHLKDASRSNSAYYDTTVVIDGVTYYEVDFSLWDGAAGKSLYAPYSPIPWNAGEILVEVGSDPIVVDKNRLSFKSSGETKNVVVESDNPWTATASEAWVTLSTSSGASGETTLSVTAPEYTSTTEDRTAVITITDGVFSVTINVKQKKYGVGVSEIYLGNLNMEAAYFGDLQVEAIYLGENQVYSSGPFQGLKLSPSSMQFTYTGGTDTLKVKSSEPWFLSYDISKVQCNPWSGNSGETTVTVTASANTGDTDITTVITGSTNSSAYTASTVVTIKYNEPFPSVPYMFNYNAKEYNTSTHTFPKKQGQLFNEDLVLNSSPTDVSADCVSFINSTAFMEKQYNTPSDNPFNRDSQNNDLTIIYKVSNFTYSEDNLVANRGYNYNYMVRGNKFHTLNSTFLEMAPIGDPYIMLIRVQPNGNSERTQLDINGNIIQSVTSSTIDYGAPSDKFAFFNGGYTGEYFNGIFYWMYLANNALSDADVLSVINYNENL